ncbi:LOW QUALITY PROTEIN: mitogen-activated protein kinase kinase kinase 18-like [Argentina anserina]|uniref:LOW QUALITY PROTEIN: mitogen-activated protein kinase kinase kinase 18-like n=1 Tax=Argentina anserina TaxID=57926 RepID=UPI002176577A|nr:LOW QUALITY PROTEIN: mitogen-activated protein kinase kinase kinase 18-like [Potentilla anserina]
MEWTRGPIIGRGSTAAVSLATGAVSGEVFAVKSAELSRSMFLRKEQCFLSKLSSPHVVKYLGCDVSNEQNEPMYNLFMEYVPGGTLSDVIRRQGKQLEEGVIRSYTQQIVQGLEYLHSNGLAHCDIKSQNILVAEESGKIKIADLGCAKLVHEAPTSPFSGTPVFMAPEVARGEEQGFEADIWALGCTLIEMATGGSSPWPEVSDPVSALYRIGFSGDLPEFPKWLSKEGKDFLSNCLTKCPRERWTAKELLEHPFLKDCSMVSTSLSSSPISVLDQGLWDSFEVFEVIPPQKFVCQSICSGSSPQERIKMLIGGTCSTFSDTPNWEFDENWFTVRSNGDEDIEALLKNNNATVAISEQQSMEATVTLDMDVDEELHSSICDDEELALEGFVESNSRIGSDGEFIISYIVTDDSFVNNLDIEQDTRNYSFFHSRFYHSCFDFSGQTVVLIFLLLMSSLFSASLIQCDMTDQFLYRLK